jgi:hypothetical protein
MPEADKEGRDFSLEQAAATEGFFLKGSNSLPVFLILKQGEPLCWP